MQGLCDLWPCYLFVFIKEDGLACYRIHSTLHVTPAMEAGLAGHAWTVEELVELLKTTAP
jgi:hypothetical protein